MSTIPFLTMAISIGAVLGIILGGIKIKGIGLGIGGVLFSGILVGHYAHDIYGLNIRVDNILTIEGSILSYVQEFGLILFVYSIGVQVGPSFFSSLKDMGAKLIGWVLIIIFLGCSIALGLHVMGLLPVDAMVGLYSGAITNTPSLGAGKQMIQDMSLVLVDAGYDPTSEGFSVQVVPSAYAMAYPFGVCGLLFSMILLRVIFRINIEEEADKYLKAKSQNIPQITTLNVKVANEVFFNKKLEEVPLVKDDLVVVSRVKRNGELLVPHHDLVLQDGDILHVVGAPNDLKEVSSKVGVKSSEVLTTRGTSINVKRVVITNPKVYGKDLGSLHIDSHYDVVVSRLIRSGVQFIPTPHMVLQFGDILNIVGSDENIKNAAKELGNSAAALNKVPMLPIFIGLALGTLLGSIPIHIAGIPAPMKLGIAGGPLVMAILLSRFGETWTRNLLHWHLPSAGLCTLREIGITLFLTIVGINAGASGFWDTLTNGPGFTWMCLGTLITFVPVFLVGVLALKAKVNYLIVCGMLAGSATNPPALAFANNLHSNPEATSLGYATVYPITMFLRILSPQIMIIIAVLMSNLNI